MGLHDEYLVIKLTDSWITNEQLKRTIEHTLHTTFSYPYDCEIESPYAHLQCSQRFDSILREDCVDDLVKYAKRCIAAELAEKLLKEEFIQFDTRKYKDDDTGYMLYEVVGDIYTIHPNPEGSVNLDGRLQMSSMRR